MSYVNEKRTAVELRVYDNTVIVKNSYVTFCVIQ